MEIFNLILVEIFGEILYEKIKKLFKAENLIGKFKLDKILILKFKNLNNLIGKSKLSF
jgi:hypothetical protein